MPLRKNVDRDEPRGWDVTTVAFVLLALALLLVLTFEMWAPHYGPGE